MSDIEINLAENLYEIQCRDCGEIIAFIEIYNENYNEQKYLCDSCAEIDNQNRLMQQINN